MAVQTVRLNDGREDHCSRSTSPRGDRLPARREIPLDVWMRVPVRERNMRLNTAKVELGND